MNSCHLFQAPMVGRMLVDNRIQYCHGNNDNLQYLHPEIAIQYLLNYLHQIINPLWRQLFYSNHNYNLEYHLEFPCIQMAFAFISSKHERVPQPMLKDRNTELKVFCFVNFTILEIGTGRFVTCSISGITAILCTKWEIKIQSHSSFIWCVTILPWTTLLNISMARTQNFSHIHFFNNSQCISGQPSIICN